MQRKKRWQFYLIGAVIALTVYNILPTLFYYTKPLKEPVNVMEANKIALKIVNRVNGLEKESVDWLTSFCKMLKIKPTNIDLNKSNPEQVTLTFAKEEDAKIFKAYLPRAGSVIPFVPAQMSLSGDANETSTKVVVKRQVPVHFENSDVDAFFQFSPKWDSTGEKAPFFKEVTFDRMAQIGLSVGGPSESALLLLGMKDSPNSYATQDMGLSLANNLVSFVKTFGENSAIAKRYFASFTQSSSQSKAQDIDFVLGAFGNLRSQIRIEKGKIEENAAKAKEQKIPFSSEQKDLLALLDKKENILLKAEDIIKRNKASFQKGTTPWNYKDIVLSLQEKLQSDVQNPILTLNVADNNPFIGQVVLDWRGEKVFLYLQRDILEFKKEAKGYLKNQIDQLLINEIAKVTRQSDENITPYGDDFVINLNQLTGSSSFLAFKLDKVAKGFETQIRNFLVKSWHPKHKELSAENFPIWDYETYLSLPKEQKTLCLVICTPANRDKFPAAFRASSVYVIAKGVDRILQKYQGHQDSAEARQFLQDFDNLQRLLGQSGFVGYSGASVPITFEFSNDFIFEKDHFYRSILAATREQFSVHGTKKFAILEFTDYEQRLLTLNKIETQMHEDLLKWQDNYNAAKVSLDPLRKSEVPPLTMSPFWSNFSLSFAKYFRGDDRKIIHWGLDLSGGKTVQIELRDQNNRVVTNDADLKQGINELYERVNKMGVSEVNIRRVGNNIVLDFPGSQGLSAQELVKASTMYFNIVNEKFTLANKNLADSVNRFLQEVWNEALVTNKKDSESINAIAWRHLYGESLESDVAQPQSEAAKILYDNGLRLSSPFDSAISSIFNDTVSKIAVLKGDDFTAWNGQTHPLMIVFKNYALDGSNLTNVRASYDPARGNFLAFEVKGSHSTKEGVTVNPRDELYAWTSHFAKEKIAGTPLESFAKGRGWRMAVILNDFIISSPNLESAIRDGATITGSFSQREINQLAADLKAGSLSFTPKILSEKNVSPELGHSERVKGIVSMIVALVAVIVVMCTYYRFLGCVASIAVLFNLLILWATLQNLQATLNLAGIAGIILTVAVAVDANVLVAERVREEFSVSHRISSALQMGYKRALPAILDSNVTTIIAALILLNFDSGPIKGFALTLIIGIISSMFSALFATRYFFTEWAKKPEHQSLKMLNLIKAPSFDFLKKSKLVFGIFLAFLLAGSAALFMQKEAILGMDFTGGFSLTLEVKEQSGLNYRQTVEKALSDKGVATHDFQVRELTPTNNIRLFLSSAFEQKGYPFFNMPLESGKKDITYAYENNPRIVWVVNALNAKGLTITPNSALQLDKNWTAMSGQMSSTMRNNAIGGLLVALFCILIYITFRFELKYAASAILSLLFNVAVSIGVISLLNILGVPVQIDMNSVAAIMTIVGYSLNDTIIIFDRIREEIKLMRRTSLPEVVNYALNATLSRTSMTSGITLLVLLVLALFGGSTIFGFAVTMIVGVIFGTLSSLFIASPLMLFFHNIKTKRLETKQKNI